MTCFQVLKH